MGSPKMPLTVANDVFHDGPAKNLPNRCGLVIASLAVQSRRALMGARLTGAQP